MWEILDWILINVLYQTIHWVISVLFLVLMLFGCGMGLKFCQPVSDDGAPLAFLWALVFILWPVALYFVLIIGTICAIGLTIFNMGKRTRKQLDLTLKGVEKKEKDG